jgi:signal transduction histidine kinase
MFDRARLRLTGWYLAILGGIVLALSVALYDALLQVQRSEAATLAGSHGVARFFAREEHALAVQILAIDLGVLILAALGAYVLAGRTLRPIEETMARQQRFAVAASHELRTPLTVLQGTMEVALLRERTPAEYQAILAEAAAEAGRMGLLVGDLLAVARAESDAAALTREPLDLADVACDAIDDVRPLAERKGQELEVAIDAPLPVRGDRLKLRQALANLLDNAVTYTPAGGTIRVVVRREHGHAVVAVRDTGPGIAPEHLPRLFEPFYRVDEAHAGGTGHAGLGLALVEWIARAHGGRLAVESRVGTGSVFTLTLPLDRPRAGAALHPGRKT